MPEFSPDGRWIALTRRTPPKAPKPQESEFEKKLDERFEGRIFDWMQYRFDRRGYLPDPRDPVATPPNELYVLPAEGGEPKQLTTLGVDVSGISWSPDSRRIAFVADMEQRNELVYRHADLWIADLEGDVQRLTSDGFNYGAPAFSPDGRRLAYRGGKGLSQVIAERSDQGAPIDLFIRDLDSGAVENVTGKWDFRPGGPTWSPDGRSLYFEVGIGGNRHLFRATDESVVQVTQGDRQLSGFAFDRAFTRMAFVSQDAVHPPEVFVAGIGGEDSSRLSRLNDGLLAGLSLSAPMRLNYPSSDGTEIEGWLILPSAGSDAAQRRPLILSIHGGPHGAYGQRFSFQFQLWAAQGYAVLYTNPRGSSGYGHDFLYATWGGGWGNLDTEDVLAGVDHVLARHPLDESRMGVTGYSYGGFLTNWVITRTERFSAAISGAGISNWISDYGTADIPRTKESEFYGTPWKAESAALLRRQSPIFYADRVSTPTLFVHGEIDFRVPIEQAEQMYTALHKLGVPARFIRYPDSYHGGWTPWNMVHRYHSELKWWEKYLSASETTSD